MQLESIHGGDWQFLLRIRQKQGQELLFKDTMHQNPNMKSDKFQPLLIWQRVHLLLLLGDNMIPSSIQVWPAQVEI